MWQASFGRYQFSAPQLLYQAEGRILRVAAGELTGDTRPEIVLQVLSANRSTLQLLKNRGTSSGPLFSEVVTIDHLATELPGDITVADINADQNADIAIAFADRSDGLVMNQYIKIPSNSDTSNFSRQQDARSRAVDQVLLADLDDDGDLDLVSGVWGEGAILISDNTRQVTESGTWTGPTHIVDRIPGLNGLAVGDINQDGTMDLVASTRDTIHIGRRTGAFRFLPFVTSTWPVTGSELVDLRDVNGDARNDLVYRSGSQQGALYVNSSGRTFPAKYQLPDLPNAHKISQFVDFDGAGVVDVLSVVSRAESGTDSVIVAQYVSPTRPWLIHTLPQDPGAKLQTADINSDGLLDIVMASPSGLSWFPSSGEGQFQPERLVFSESVSGVLVGDFDGDRDVDFMFSATDHVGRGQLIILENITQSANFVRHVIMPTSIVPRQAGDLDGDGDTDAIAIALERDGIYLILNQGSVLPAVQRVAGKLSSYDAAALIDQDRDGKLNIVAVNDDGESEVLGLVNGTYHSIWVGGELRFEWSSAQSADVDGDGDLDVVVWSRYDKTADWFETVMQEPGVKDQEGRILNARSALIGDVDGDGDVDIITNHLPQEARWVMNLDGHGRFSDSISFTIRRAVSAVADLSADGRVDLLAMDDGQIVWFENQPAANGDFNGDARLDHGDVRELRGAAFAELDPELTPAPLFDLDGSGEVDHQDTLYWATDVVGTSRFDVNRDGRFDSGDLVSLFQHGQYEQRFAYWYQGDFDGDGDFTTSDLVLAMQSGEYENP
jgi:hypothetical protein